MSAQRTSVARVPRDASGRRAAAAAAARRTAGELVEAMRASGARVHSVGGVDLDAVLEQALFYAIRDDALGDLRGNWVPAIARLPVRLARDAGAWVTRSPPPALASPPIAILALAPSHVSLVEPVLDELRRREAPAAVVLRAGFDAPAERASTGTPSAQLWSVLDATWLRALARHELEVARDLGRATAAWGRVTPERARALRSFAGAQLSLLGRYAAHLASAVAVLRPRLLVTFDEHGRWSRLLPAVSRSRGIPSLTLPHAEAADAVAIGRLAYDRIAVYGPRAAEVMVHAGNDRERIVEIGPLRFDALVHKLDQRRPGTESRAQRRVVFTTAPVIGMMTRELKAATTRSALAAAAAVAPCELVVKRHPAERSSDGIVEAVIAERPPADGVSVRITSDDLHDLLLDAWLLVTGPSQSVFDAAIAGVPAISIAATAEGTDDPVPFAGEGISVDARDPASAAAASRRMLDPQYRAATTELARRQLEGRLGPLDGRSYVRAADLILELAAHRGKG